MQNTFCFLKSATHTQCVCAYIYIYELIAFVCKTISKLTKLFKNKSSNQKEKLFYFCAQFTVQFEHMLEKVPAFNKSIQHIFFILFLNLCTPNPCLLINTV